VLPPQLVVDSSGWAFAYPLYRLAGVRVASYTHYPTISADMLQRVRARQAAFNNDAAVSGSALKSAVKLLYYYLFAAAYGAVGGCANVRARQGLLDPESGGCEGFLLLKQVCTRAGGHGEFQLDATAHCGAVVDAAAAADGVPALQRGRARRAATRQEAEVPLHGVPGPGAFLLSCQSWWETAALLSAQRAASIKLRMRSLARLQFRPEKDHAQQLRAFAMARRKAASAGWSVASEAILAARLKLVGSSRDADDEQRVQGLVRLPLLRLHVSFVGQWAVTCRMCMLSAAKELLLCRRL
jgi:alpha-1,2-mannosyltransferase